MDPHGRDAIMRQVKIKTATMQKSTVAAYMQKVKLYIMSNRRTPTRNFKPKPVLLKFIANTFCSLKLQIQFSFSRLPRLNRNVNPLFIQILAHCVHSRLHPVNLFVDRKESLPCKSKGCFQASPFVLSTCMPCTTISSSNLSA